MASLKLKYTSVEIEAEEDTGDGYCGYLAVQFDYNSPIGQFFMDSYDDIILSRILEFMNKLVGGYTKEEIRIEDTSLLIDLKKSAYKKFAPDIAKIVKDTEKEFDSKVG